jgi:ATP-dependent Clp protease ATP-binding subunit ClpC
VQEYLQQHRVEDAVNAPSNEAGSEAWQTYVSRYQLNKLTHQALQFAREEAQTFQHPYIGPEHLLLGVLRVSEGTAAQVLNALGVQLESARNGVRLVVGHGECEADQALDLTIPTKKMITDAQQEARHRNYPSIGTEHLLLSLVRTGEGVIPQVLESMGVSVEMVRARVLHYPGPLGPPPLRRS